MKRAILAVVFLISISAVTFGQVDSDRESLKGIPDLEVVVENLPTEIGSDGLTKDQLQTDVELRLRKAGIRVVSATLSGYLYVNVNIMKSKTVDLYGFSVNVEYKQSVSLLRNKSIVTATTWNTSAIGLAKGPDTGKISYVRSSVGDMIDRFINDYLAANPK